MNYIYFSTYLTTNFKPKHINNFNNLNFFKKNKNQIFCRNLFLFLLLIKYKKNFFFDNSSILIKPYKRKIYTILRSPYRHKLARHQLVLNRYYITSSIRLKNNNIFKTTNFKNIIKLFNFFKTFNFWFESNIISNYKIKFSYSFYYNFNFKLTNFLKNSINKK